MKRRIEKVFFEPSIATGDGATLIGDLHALCNDGSLWCLCGDTWHTLPDIPEIEDPQESEELDRIISEEVNLQWEAKHRELEVSKAPRYSVDCDECQFKGYQTIIETTEDFMCEVPAPEVPVAYAQFSDGAWYSLVAHGGPKAAKHTCTDCGISLCGSGTSMELFCFECMEKRKENE